jgi:predicted RNA-binding protein (virulence factor B family)/ribosome-associated protein YbcJ (S4-like RNA binding protein)
MITLGQYYSLPVGQRVDDGYMLDAGELGEVLLPARHVPEKLKTGNTVDVFLYLDTDEIPVATTGKPKACVGEFAYLKVAETTDIGAFLDWGLEKDVLAPFAEQHRPMHEGRSYLVYLYLNKIDGRITATSKIDKVLDDDKSHDYEKGQPVDLIVANTTDLGFKAIINHSHWGVLYTSDVHQRLSFGQSIQGYIKHVRPDGKIDLILQVGKGARDKNAESIVNYLNSKDGFAPVHDNSDPKTIVNLLGMSKGAFKKAIGKLYRERIIIIEEEGIRLLQQEETEGVNEDSEVPTNEPEIVSEIVPEKIPEKVPEKVPEKKPEENTAQNQRIVELSREPIELYKILKFEGLATSGGEARNIVAEGHVLLNGKVETQKRKKIMSGDVIEFGNEKLTIQLGKQDDQ